MTVEQLVLGMHLNDDSTFDNFVIGNNQEVTNALQWSLHKKNEPFIYLWGPSGAGRSHLLQAACHQAYERGLSVMYLPFRNPHIAPPILVGLEQMDLVCLDDIHKVLGHPDWEEALFNFYNRTQAHQHRLFVTAPLPITQLPCQLADLRSRLTAGLTLSLHALTDEQKLMALQHKATSRGLTLSPEVGQFILHHLSRDMSALTRLLDQLDRVSLMEKRRLTIPFVKYVLNRAGD